VALAATLGLPEIGNRIAGIGWAGVAVMLQLLRLRRFRGYALQGAFSMSLLFSSVAGAPDFTVEGLGEPART
jgi:hypothetical protein